jgi:hypothetical protein
VSMSAKEATQQAMSLPTALLHTSSERVSLCCLACILLTIRHLLEKLLGFLLIDKRQPSLTVLQLECMEESSVLVVCPFVIYLLVPDNSSTGTGNVHQFQPICISYQVICQDHRPLKARIGPFRAFGICNVKSCYGNSLNLV